MTCTYTKEDPRTPSSRSSFSNPFISGTFRSLPKGIKDTLLLKFKKNKERSGQVGKEGRSGQRNGSI
jgi:hypothetical protein